MHSSEILGSAELALTELHKHSTLIEGARIISMALGNIERTLSAFNVADQNKLLAAANSAKNSLTGVKTTVISISPKSIFTEIESLEKSLSIIQNEKLSDAAAIDDVRIYLDVFSEHYEEFIKGYTTSDAAPLVFSAMKFTSKIDSLISSYELVLNSLTEENRLVEDENLAELSIYLHDVDGVQDFAEKLGAIADLYETIGRLAGVNTNTSPLLIEYIESGSLRAKVFGEPKVINFIIEALREGAAFLYRKYTKEGKISSIPTKLESLNNIIDLSENLQKAGIDTAEIKEELRIAAVGIAKDLNELLKSQYKVKINGEEQSLVNPGKQEISHEKWKEKLKITYEGNDIDKDQTS